MQVLRLEIYQPTAHYRIPYGIQRRLTYPIPPYSTVVGFLCNACGIYDQNMDLYRVIRELKMAISGRFGAKNTEYVWFRNLSKRAHISYYGEASLRYRNGEVGHIGGQMPVRVDVLEDVELIIYLYHEYHENISRLKEKLETLEDRLQPIHLGRAEDWIVIKDLKLLEDRDVSWKRVDGAYDYFFWIPEKLYYIRREDSEKTRCFQFDWRKIEGNIYFLTGLSKVQGYEDHRNHAGRKTYEKIIKVKLNDGKIKNVFSYFDEERKIPIFLGDME